MYKRKENFMKKLIALALIFVISLSVVACGGTGSATTTTTTTTTTTPTTTTTTTGNDKPDPDPTTDFTEDNTNVYILADSLYIRKTPTLPEDNANVFKSANYGESFLRVGYNDTWSKLLIDGVEYFASTKYLSTSKIVNDFDEREEVVYIVGTDSIRIRSKTTLNNEFSTTVDYKERGEAITRTGIATEEDGEGILWSRVELMVKDENGNDKLVEGYVNSKYLGTEPETPDVPDVDVEFEYKTDVLKVIADSLNLRTYPKFEEGSLSGKSASKDDLLIRIGVAKEADDEGITWSMVIYNGNLYYISSNPSYTKVEETATVEDTEFSAFDSSYSITLPSYFFYASESVDGTVIAALNEAVTVAYSGDLGEVAMTAKEYAATLIQVLALDADVVEENGLVYFAFEMESEGQTLYAMVFINAGAGNDYYITTIEGIGTEDDFKDAFIDYAASIKIIWADAE